MKILCAYHDEEVKFLDHDPELELSEHKVVVVHSYQTICRKIEVACLEDDQFDVVLMDLILPWDDHLPELGPSILCSWRLVQCGVKGMGVFVPSCLESHDLNLWGPLAVAADKTCIDVCGRRDWKRLLMLVNRMMSEM